MTQENPPKPKPKPGSDVRHRRRRRRRSSRHMLASTFGIILLILLAGLGAVIWRLDQGPIKLTRLLPAMEERFAKLVPGYAIDVGNAELIWESRNRRPRLRLEQVQLTRKENGRVSRFGRLQADLSLSALAMGGIRLNKVELQDMEITIERTAGGELMFSLPGIEGSGGRLDFRDLVSSAENGPLSVITELSVRNLMLSLRDASTGEFWAAPAANAVLRSGDKGLEIDLETESLGTGWPLRGHARLASNGTLELVLSGNRINSQSLPPFVAGFIPDPLRAGELDGAVSLILSPFGAVEAAHGDVAVHLPDPLPVEFALGRFTLENVSAEGVYDPRQRRFQISSMTMGGDGFSFEGRGAIGHPSVRIDAPAAFSLDGRMTITADAGVYPATTTLDRIVVKGEYSPLTGRLALGLIELNSGAVAIRSSAVIDQGEAGITVRIDGRVDPIRVADLKRLWPPSAAPGAYSWVMDNLLGGQIGKATFSVSSAPAGGARDDSLAMDFTFRDISSYHIGRATPITGAQGRAHLTLETFELQIEEGHIGDIALTGGSVSIPDLNADVQTAGVALNFTGKARHLLAFLDEPPISALASVDINPAKVGGVVSGSVSADLPLLADLALDDVAFKVTAKTRGLAAQNIVEGYSITKGNLTFTANQDQLRARGPVALNQVPLTIDWTEQFDLTRKQTTRLGVSAQLDEVQRRAIGLDLAPYVSGPVAVKLFSAGKGTAITRANVEADLTGAVLTVPDTSIKLAKSTPKQLTFGALFDGDRTRLRDVSFTSPDMRITGGEMDLIAGKLQTVAVSRLIISNMADIGLRYSLAGSDGADLDITGRYLDLSRLLAGDGEKSPGGGGLDQLDDLPKISVQAALGQFKISRALVIDDLQLSLASRPGDLTVLQGEARFAGSKPLQAVWKRSVGGTRNFIVKTEDAGSVLRALGFYERAVDGQLSLTGNFNPSGAGRSAEIGGRAVVRNMIIRGVSSLSDILDVGAGASLASLSEEMKSQGVSIDIVEVPFTIGETEITIKNAFARGESVGFTFAGTIDRDAGKANIGGTIIPAYGLNSYLGDIPVIGNILVGRAKEGVVGITYSVTGPISDPDVSVNPLSALAPGILRRIFDQHGGDPDGAKTKQAPGANYPGDEENNADP